MGCVLKILSYVVVFIIGGFLGMLTMALCNVSARADKRVKDE